MTIFSSLMQLVEHNGIQLVRSYTVTITTSYISSICCQT